MKRIFIALLLVCLTAFLAHLNAQTTGWNYNATSEKADAKPAEQTYKKLPRNARKQFDGMTFVPAGTFVMNRLEHYITATANDTCLLLGNVPRRVSVDAFFISNHEVSNSEYRAFTSWVTMRTAMDILASHYPERCLPNGHYNEAIPVDWNDSLLNGNLYFADEQRFIYKNMLNTDKLIYNYPDADTGMIGIPIYPDTLCWVNDFRYSYNEPFSRLYFQHPAYDNYPVAGVSWNQAMAYCQWRTDRLNEDILISKKILKQKSYYFSTHAFLADSVNSNYACYLYPSFRLPTEAEWEYAALEVDPKTNKQSVYPWWGSTLYNNKGQWLVNAGPIFDVNGVCIKSYTDDGASLTAPIMSYFPNSKGLYN
ncbi:MAG: SUMF1/EgtB/PvdO family nonheme iron enzyme, partial [Bacteroidales bacterium]|nr:SUMF1/EgtB/PvdO family nonheme iron enzyme [Bacteroidales bacterium]